MWDVKQVGYELYKDPFVKIDLPKGTVRMSKRKSSMMIGLTLITL